VWGISLLKVYPGSHKFQTIEELRESGISPVVLPLYPNQVLFTCGGLWMEEGSGEGYLMWMGVSLSIIGLHVDKYCLTFIARAYKASQFLSWQLPLGRIKGGAEELIQQHPPYSLEDRLSSRRSGRSESAERILELSVEGYERTERFLAELGDPTRLMLSASYAATDNPITAFLTCHRSEDPNDWLMRAVVTRLLVCQYRSGSYTSVTEFLRLAGLPDTRHTRNALANGLKMDYLKVPGLWIVMMRVISRFPQLPIPEVHRIPALLSQYGVVQDAGSRWTRFMEESVQLYSMLISSLRDDR
jgi:hypothetical protein